MECVNEMQHKMLLREQSILSLKFPLRVSDCLRTPTPEVLP